MIINKSRLEIQNIAEEILAKHNIDPSAKFYLRLSMPPYMDLIIERNGSIIWAGHYRHEDGEIMGDPVLVMEDLGGYWSPLRTEQWCENTFFALRDEDGKLMIYLDRIEEFKSFQKMFAKNIREQGWLENSKSILNLQKKSSNLITEIWL